jgi:glycosyltransferase involved in cell wall biosynthesis
VSTTTLRRAPFRPVRAGLLLDGEEYGVRSSLGALLQAITAPDIQLVGLFAGAGPSQSTFGPHCDEVYDLRTGSLFPLRRPDGRPPDLSCLLVKVFRFVRMVLALMAAIRRLRLDLVYVNYFPLHLVAGLACRLTNTPCIWHRRGVSTRGGAYWMMRLFGAVLPTVIICNSHFVARSMPRRARPRCRVVYNGVRTRHIRENQRHGVLRARLGLSSEHSLVSMFGSLTRYKGHEYFIRAAAHVIREFPAARFAIVGAQAALLRDARGMEAELRRLVDELGLADRVLFTGHLDEACLSMADCDIVCMPTVPLGIGGEGFGLVIAEAMAAGVPVVATNCGAPPEIIEDGRSGILVPPFDSEALGRAILRLLCDNRERRALGAAGQQRVVQHFDISRTARALEAIFREFGQRRGTRAVRCTRRSGADRAVNHDCRRPDTRGVAD